MKKFAVVLSGCGVFDGAEIHEATLTMYAIMKHGATYEIFAPDIPQHHVINHLTGKEMNESRNVLVESARIARGKIKPLSEFDPSGFDALIFPGGMVSQGKPVGALCISPVLVAKVLSDVELTIGQDAETAKAIEKMGARHVQTGHGEVVVDKKYKVATTPCYMLDANIVQIGDGAMNVVKTLLELAAE